MATITIPKRVQTYKEAIASRYGSLAPATPVITAPPATPIKTLATSTTAVDTTVDDLVVSVAALSNTVTALSNSVVAVGDGLTGIGTSILTLQSDVTTLSTAKANSTNSSLSGNTTINSLGIGTAATGTTGEIRATNNITAYYSDDQLKTRLGKIENALDKIDQLTGFYYEANELAQSMGYQKVREVGVSAQDTKKVMGEIVAPAPIDDRYLTVRYERFAPLLIEGIKELRAEIKLIKQHLNI